MADGQYMTVANLQTEWAALLFKSLADAGVRDVVISPGSRSTPFVAAAVREKRLARHVEIDERAAAFFALGQARVTSRPSVLVCTSGTAAAHYFPAILEANLEGIPLLMLTSDRPHELYECRSPQTIDQVKLFGQHARQFFDLVADPSDASLRALRRIAAQAVLATAWPQAGAVQLNARARKPLEPVVAKQPEELRLAKRAQAIGERPIALAPPPQTMPSNVAVSAAAEILEGAARGVIVAGAARLTQRAARDAVFALSEATGFPIAADTASQLRFGPRPRGVRFLDALEVLAASRAFRAKAAFDVAIQIGASPISGAWEEIAPTLTQIILAEHGWHDPHSTARVMIYGDIATACRALAERVRAAKPSKNPEFWRFLERAQIAATRAAEGALAEGETLHEAFAIRSLLEVCPNETQLMLGNSLAVRVVNTYAPVIEDREIAVLSQRGASGIDGLVAGTAGAAIASGKPTALVIGDVSLLHDLTSLRIAAKVKTPLVVFVLHNGGGRIFEHLPLGDAPDLERDILESATTPHDTDFSHAAALHGLRYVRVSKAADTSRLTREAFAHAGCTLLEVRVAPAGALTLRRRVREVVDEALARVDENVGA